MFVLIFFLMAEDIDRIDFVTAGRQLVELLVEQDGVGDTAAVEQDQVKVLISAGNRFYKSGQIFLLL